METPSYYRYLSDVLGIETLILPEVVRGENLEVEGNGTVMFLGSSVLSEPREKELLHKMIVALGLEPQSVLVAEGLPTSSKVFEDNQIKTLILLGEDVCEKLGKSFSEIRGQVLNENNQTLLATFEPKSLLKNPDLKKQAWNDLKKIIPFVKA